MPISVSFQMVLTVLGWLTLVGYIETTLEFMIGNRKIRRLREIALLNPQAQFPRVSIIIPARNEERHIRSALTSVLHLDYPDYELLVLNDRSEDSTGAILTEMCNEFSRLRVVHIDALPNGWLGKNHALWLGAKEASGELLLFTDADIVMEPTALRRAVQLLQANKVDHLAVMPEIHSSGLALGLFLNAFSVYFALYSRPWWVSHSKVGAYIGIGAFNLIRKSCYEAVGTHQAIALRPDDDVKLGKLVKRNGFRQEAANGVGSLSVEWYASLNELVDGLMKNAFAGLDYSVPNLIFGVLAQFLFGVWPVIGLFLADGSTWWLYALSVFLMQVLCFDNARFARLNRLSGLVFPLSTLLMIYILIRAAVITLAQNGIRWRGTFYPLAALRTNRV